MLGTADGLGTNAIMREAGAAKTAVWRWQERFIDEGVDGLLRDKTATRSGSTSSAPAHAIVLSVE